LSLKAHAKRFALTKQIFGETLQIFNYWVSTINSSR